MIEKTIKIGPGRGPCVDMSQYKNASVCIRGLSGGLVKLLSDDGTELIASADGSLPVLDETRMIQVWAETKSCVIVKLLAEAI
jgi:hypothetical protein